MARIAFICLTYWAATKTSLTPSWGIPLKNVYYTVNIIFSAAMGAGTSMSNLPSVQKAKDSARKIFEIMDEPSKLDVRVQPLNAKNSVDHGRITFHNLSFKYPSRDTLVLKDFSLVINAA